MEHLKTREQLQQELSAPLPREAVKDHPTKQNMSTIKAIYVTERLNDVFGIGRWTLKTDLVAPITTINKTTSAGKARTEYTSLMKTILEVPDYGIYYECVAGSSNDDEGDSAKGGTTDGITKICSWLGIGIEVFKGKVGATAKPSYQKPSAPSVKPPAPKATATQKETPAKESQIKPSETFDTFAGTKPANKEDEAARATALGLFKKLDQATVLAYLIKDKKIAKYATVDLFVAQHDIAEIRAIYSELNAKKP